MERIADRISGYIAGHVPSLAAFALKALLCIAVYFAGKKVIYWLVRAVRRMMERAKVEAGAVTFTASVVKIFLYVILILGIAVQFGVKESSVAAVVASGGVAVGLALQGGLSNFAGGFLILLFKPFQVGDYIITQGQEGTVCKIEILYTTLHTFDNRRVIVPNGTLANNVIVNVTASEKRKLELKVGIAYEDSIAAARAVMERIVAEDPDVLQEEERQVFVSELADSAVVMGLRCWVRTDSYLNAMWRMNERIKNEFDAAGLHIPYPQMEVHVAGDAEAGKRRMHDGRNAQE